MKTLPADERPTPVPPDPDTSEEEAAARIAWLLREGAEETLDEIEAEPERRARIAIVSRYGTTVAEVVARDRAVLLGKFNALRGEHDAMKRDHTARIEALEEVFEALKRGASVT